MQIATYKSSSLQDDVHRAVSASQCVIVRCTETELCAVRSLATAKPPLRSHRQYEELKKKALVQSATVLRATVRCTALRAWF